MKKEKIYDFDKTSVSKFYTVRVVLPGLTLVLLACILFEMFNK